RRIDRFERGRAIQTRTWRRDRRDSTAIHRHWGANATRVWRRALGACGHRSWWSRWEIRAGKRGDSCRLDSPRAFDPASDIDASAKSHRATLLGWGRAEA